ncbi:MAG TPA: hypothetical protein VNH16_06825 [Burkholderiales bacterium]|jgi:hypothetical protein|nr:hypothetical protein [Burkholderiales bacterium]
MKLDYAIRAELARAAVGLGASRAEAKRISSKPRSEIHSALSNLGADRLLLALVATWRDSNDELGVLYSLREWIANGDFKYFQLPPRDDASK